jgi:divalent metal cation (Fe/Co/Zn/Cd) transporter
VSLHVQVNKDAPLSEAHALADAVEDSIRRHLGNVDNITVHLEPHMPELARVRPASSEIKESIKDLILARNDVERIDKIAAYATDFNVLKIDIVCVFKTGSGVEMTIEQAHKRVSEMEELIRSKYPGSIVTIHAEPK